MTGIGENTLAQPVKLPLRERRACLAKLVKNRLTLTRIDLGARGLAVGGETVPLTPTEYAICEHLARHPGQVMSRAQIREAVLGWESDADDAAISMQVSRARRKLSEAGADPIATVWGMGYKWQL